MAPHWDNLSMSIEQMTSRRAIMMGGRIAEEMIFGRDKVTSGVQYNIEQATCLARMMVTKRGLSPELGTVAFGENLAAVLRGGSMGCQQNISEAAIQKIMSDVLRIVEDWLSDKRPILTQKQHELEALAPGLPGYETLTGDEIRAALDCQPPACGFALPTVRDGRPLETHAAWSLNRRANHCLTEVVCGPRTCLLEKLVSAESYMHRHVFQKRSNHALPVKSYFGHIRRRIQHEALH